MHRVGNRFPLIVLAALLCAAPVRAGDLDGDCRVGDAPAATLLIPYFEVDLDNPGGVTTLFSIGNARRGFAALARVTLWTDWGIPTGGFDVFLLPGDVQTINLRDLFNTGEAPQTSGIGLSTFPDCPDPVGGPFADAGALRRAHTGRQVVSGLCFAQPRSDTSRATGYVTVDHVRRCSAETVTPGSGDYFLGPDPVASTENVLWGDFFLVDPEANLSQGQTAISVLADPDRFGPGDETFYERLVLGLGFDARAPLSSEWRARFATAGTFDDTELLVWRDIGDSSISPVPCGSLPGWHPLTERRLSAWAEDGSSASFVGPPAFPLATQRLSVDDDLDPPYGFGYMDLWLDFEDGTENQAWVVWLMRSDGRFSVGQNGIRVNDLCPPVP